MKSVKTAVEVETVLQYEYSKKLVADGRKIYLDPFRSRSHGWQTKEEGMVFWPIIPYCDIFSCFVFNPSELGSNDLSDYKNCYFSYYMSGWLQPLMYHKLNFSFLMMSVDIYNL